MNNNSFNPLKPGHLYRTPSTKTTIKTTTTKAKAPHRNVYRPTPANKTTAVPLEVSKAVPVVPAKTSDRQTDKKILNFVKDFATGNFYNSLQSSLTTRSRITTTRTTTTTSTPAPAAPDSDDLVLDFSSGQAQVVKSTAEKVNPISDQGLAKEGIKGFDIFKGLIDKLGLEDQFQDQNEKLTIFTPGNDAFSELPFDVNTLDTNALTKLITKHFILGVLDSKSLPDGPVISHCTSCCISSH